MSEDRLPKRKLSDIKLKLEKGMPEMKHYYEVPYQDKYPCQRTCKQQKGPEGTEGPACDDEIIKIVKNQCGFETDPELDNGLSWIDQTYMNPATEHLLKLPENEADKLEKGSAAYKKKVPTAWPLV
eukprot:TRINITY_DN1758_c0_g1_i2.p1 TRINITY_DN1758_c0_g1~~TRINITY_DN1758_c0_g1_i2.p1  ORF type:complete len:126 (+),score=33.14 TRINITY_DN1758_c0_g1_i2:228-605(+)